MKIPKDRKTENITLSEISIYLQRGDYKIKNNEIMYSKDIERKLKRGIYQEYSSSYKRATRQANKWLLSKHRQK